MKTTPHYLLSVLVLALALVSCRDQSSPVSLTWQHLGNDIDPNICVSTLTVHNTSRDTLFSNWAIYWNQMSVAPLTTEGEQAHLTQIQASYHSLTPTSLWQPLPPDSSRTLTLRYKGSIMRRSGAPQGAFIILNDARNTASAVHPRPVSVPTRYLYSPDAHEFRWHIAGFPYADGEEVYKQNLRFADCHGYSDNPIHLLPQPKQITLGQGTCNLWKAQLQYDLDTLLPYDGYRLVITGNHIHMYVQNEGASLMYARQTLEMLQYQYPQLPCCEITDWPDTQHRGFMLDIARNFTGKQEIFRIIDLLALYKMNVLHLHLTDDEGWRIEIPGLPELTEVGSKRGFTTNEHDCLYPMYSGGWNPDDKQASGNGFLTRNDFIDILRYAKSKHIAVLPEIDMPGHSRAAIKAMEARYYKYIDSDPQKAEEYLLSDFQDTSRYVSAQHYTDNVICIALPSCYTFAQKVIDEVVAMYKEADAPLTIFHVGGDEVPRGAWLGSPKVAEYVANLRVGIEGLNNTSFNDNTGNNTPDNRSAGPQPVNSHDVANLKDSFLETLVAMLDEYGLQAAGWEEVAYRQGQPNPRFAGKNVLTYAWNSVPEWRGDEKPYRLANAGYPVMICSVCNLYMDMCYLNHEQESGLNWGGYVDEYRSFDLRPDSLYLSVRRTMRGEERDLNAYLTSGKTELLPDSAKNLQGVQAQLWSETIRNPQQLERYLLPKLLGTAERTWNNTWQGSYQDALRNYNLCLANFCLPYLKHKGYCFHLSQPGIHRQEGPDGHTVCMNSAVPQAEIRYTTDGSEPDIHSPLYNGPFLTDAPLINACCFYLGEKSNITHSSMPND